MKTLKSKPTTLQRILEWFHGFTFPFLQFFFINLVMLFHHTSFKEIIGFESGSHQRKLKITWVELNVISDNVINQMT